MTENKPTQNSPTYLDYEGAREYLTSLGVPLSKFTLRKYVSYRRIPFYKVGNRVLFTHVDLEEWLAAGRVEPVKGVRE